MSGIGENRRVSDASPSRGRSPALLCYDGSHPAAWAIERAAAVLGGGPAIVLCVWESLGSALLRSPLPGLTELGREVRSLSNDVVDSLDSGVAADAAATAAEGEDLARRHGSDARAQTRRAVSSAGEHAETTVWHAIVTAAEEEDVAVVVLGTRGRSRMKAALLGSVSYGVVHNCERPVLIVPAPGERG